jgi:hypothetical protein
MDKICAVVDAQGFYVKGQFYVRECAIVCDIIEICDEFDPEIVLSDLNDDEIKNVEYCTRYLHGLPLIPTILSIPKSSTIDEYLKSLHKLLAKEDKFYFGVKNNQFKEILAKSGIPYLDLNTLEIPSIEELEKLNSLRKSWVCKKHFIRNNRQYRCAYLKCLLLWKYINQKDISK